MVSCKDGREWQKAHCGKNYGGQTLTCLNPYWRKCLMFQDGLLGNTAQNRITCTCVRKTQHIKAYRNAYRKVFEMHAWQSVKELQFMCERLDFRHICSLKKFLFLHKVIIKT